MITAADISWNLSDPPADDLPSGDDLLVVLVAEAHTYRMLAQQAIHLLHELYIERRARELQHERLRAEYRALGKRTINAEAQV